MIEEITIRSVKKCVTGETVFEMKIDNDVIVGNSKEVAKEISTWMDQRQKMLQSR